MKKNEESVPIRLRQMHKKASVKNDIPAASRQKVKINYSDMEVSEYYLDASKRYRKAKWLSFFLLIVFLAVNLLFFRSNITYSNLMYLLRDLDTGGVVEVGEFAGVSYTEDSRSAYGIFKGRLAIASSSGFRLYNQAGSRELDESGYMQNPALVSGDKYAVAYDIGGTSYAVYTTMACVLEGTEKEIIEDACVSDSGSYAIMTRSNESKYLISVYKENFKLQTKYYKDKYPCDLAMSLSGDALAIVSADISVSGISTEIMLCTPGSEETSSLTVADAMPLAANYLPDGRLEVLCDTKLVVVSGGEIAETYEFSGKSVDQFSFCDGILAVSCNGNSVSSENEVFLFDSTGKLVYNRVVKEKVKSVCGDNGAVYVLCEDKILMLSFDGSEKTSEATALTEAILPLYGGLVKCESLGASSVAFS